MPVKRVSKRAVKLEFRRPFSLFGPEGKTRPRTSQADRQEWILDQLHQQVKLTRVMVEDQFGIRKKQAKRMLGPLVRDGLIAFVRAPRPGYYTLLSKGVSSNPGVTP